VSDHERVRLFVALELSDQALHALVRWREEALRDLEGLRLIEPEHLHVTLCFLGWRDAAEVQAIEEACNRASRSIAELELGPSIWLPPRRPRVLAVELLEAGGTLASCQAALAGELECGGFYRPEKRPFRPHVTVARVRRGQRAPARALPPPPPLRFHAAAVTLFRSRLASTRARYEALARTASVPASGR
jgi:2'-5' RNA ligase